MAAGSTFTIAVGDARLSGRRTDAVVAVGPGGRGPLIVALHGGSYSSAFFDVPGYSLLDRAANAGCDAIALDRPGYRDSSLIADRNDTLVANAERLDAVIARLWEQAPDDTPGVVLIGHSIGAAIAILIAGRHLCWPLLGIALSGIGMVFPANGPPFERKQVTVERVDVPLALKNDVMFGPAGTYAPDAPAIAAVANEPAVYLEIADINCWWPAHAEEMCAKVQVPVHYRQGEHDIVWSQLPEDFDRFQAAFGNAPVVDADITRHAGHSIDLHLVGAAFQAEQIAFAKACAVR